MRTSVLKTFENQEQKAKKNWLDPGAEIEINSITQPTDSMYLFYKHQ